MSRSTASLLLCFLAAVARAQGPAPAEPAAQAAPSCSIFRGNLARTGELKTKALAELHGVKWKFKVGDKPQDLAWSYPLVADGLVFMGSTDNNRGTQKYLHAVDVETGRERWKFPTATVVNKQPALEDVQGIHCLGDGLIYFTGESGYLYAVDPGTGKEAWRKLHVGDVTLYKGLLYHAGGRAVEACEAKTGEKQPWRFKIAEPVATGTFAIADGIIYFLGIDWGGQNGTLYAVELDGAKELWKFQPAGGGMTPAIAGGNLPVVADGTVFIGGTRADRFYALDAKSGREKWSAPVEKGTRTAAAVAEGAVFLIDAGGNLRALNAADGSERWKSRIGGEIVSDPVVAEGTVYCAVMRRVFALSAKDGSEKWHFDAEGFVWSPINVADGVVYFGDWKGWLYALH